MSQQHDGILPPLQGAGPKLPAGPLEPIPDYDLELAERIYLHVLEDDGLHPLPEVIRKTIMDYPVSWEGCRATLDYMLTELTVEDIEHLPIQDFDMKRVLCALRAPEA